jgi:hypothetical protein
MIKVRKTIGFIGRPKSGAHTHKKVYNRKRINKSYKEI